MEPKKVVKDVAAVRGWSFAVLAKEAGYSGPSAIGNMLARSSGMRIDNFIRLMDAMGCEIIVRDKMGSKKEWHVTNEES